MRPLQLLTGLTAGTAVCAALVAGESLALWNLAWTAAGLCGVFGLMAGARMVTRPQWLAWRLLLGSAALWLLGQLLWDLFEATGTGASVPGPADLAWLAVAPLMAIALSRLLAAKDAGARWAWLETLALIAAAATLVGGFLYSAVAESGGSDALKATAVAYPLFFLSVPIVVIQGLLTSEISPRRAPAIYVLVAGTIVQAVAFALWSPQLLSGTYHVGTSAVDPFWALGMIAVGIGGAVYRAREQPISSRRDRRLAGLLPAAMFFPLIVAVWVAADVDAPVGARHLFQAGLLVLGAILIVRSALLVHDQRRLIRTTESALTELRLTREASARFFEMSSDLLATLSNGRIVQMNPTWQQALGWTMAELTAGSFLDFIHPDDRALTERSIAALVAGTPRLSGIENRWRTKGGDYRWINWRSHRSLHDDLIYASGTDVTDSKEMQARLEQLVDERTRELRSSNEELEAFAYSVSHDLRAPLRAVAGFAHALEEDCADRLGEDGRDYVQRIVGGAARMGGLIDELLSLSRITRREMKLEAVDLAEITFDVVTELRATEPDRELRVDVDGDLHTTGDPVLLEAMLRNLIGNAWKFTGRTDQPLIQIGTQGTNGKRIYYVRDNGAGFDPQHAGKLFRPFERLHRAEEFSGTGIGLATVRRIVARHGGEVWADSRPGEGATFYFTLPTEARK